MKGAKLKCSKVKRPPLLSGRFRGSEVQRFKGSEIQMHRGSGSYWKGSKLNTSIRKSEF